MATQIPWPSLLQCLSNHGLPGSLRWGSRWCTFQHLPELLRFLSSAQTCLGMSHRQACLLTHSVPSVSGRKRSQCWESQTEHGNAEREEWLYLTNHASDTLTQSISQVRGRADKTQCWEWVWQGGFCSPDTLQKLGNNCWIVLSFHHSVDEVQPLPVTRWPDCANLYWWPSGQNVQNRFPSIRFCILWPCPRAFKNLDSTPDVIASVKGFASWTETRILQTYPERVKYASL